MFSKTILLSAFAALAAAQSAVLTFTNVPNPVTDGQAQAITFATNDTTTPVSIILRQGASTDLQDVETLTENAQNGQFIWTPKADLPNGNNYALQIRQGTEVNYFGPFSVQGATESSSSSSSSVSVSASPVPSANSTTSVPVIVTPAGTAASAAGTGVSVSRNTTMSMATLTATTTSSKPTATGTATNDAGFQGTGTSSTDAASSTGAASSFQVGSGIALFGAIAAGIFLQ